MRQGLEIDSAGTKRWFKDGLLHRDDGPAVEYPNDGCMYFKHGKSHRLDGPADVLPDGIKYWYIDDEPINCKTNEEFLRIVNLKAFW